MRRALPFVVALLAACAAPGGGDDETPSAESDSGLTYQDALAKKVYPTNKDRSLACPTVATKADHYAPATADLAGVEVEDALRGVVADDLHVAVILVRRVDGKPVYRYLSNGTANAIYQPWSSTKWMATANAAAHLREASSGDVGLTSTVAGIPMGDLVTGITTYQPKLSSSNGLARFMHEIGGHARAKARVTEWLGRTHESFGGNYGDDAPALSSTFVEDDGAKVTMPRDTAGGFQNQLSALTEAEFLKRLVMHREDEATRLPGIQWKDLEVLFYGAEHSKWYPTRAFGGMSADTAIYVQSALDMTKVEEDSKGTFRIFSKLGFGVPSDPARGNGEFVQVTYACLPELDDAAKPIPDAGHELIIAAMLGRGGSSMQERDTLFAKNHQAIVKKVLAGDFD